MEPAADLRDLLSGPPGRYFAGATWAEFLTEEGIAGHLIWGRPTEEDARHFMQVEAPAGAPLAQRRPRYFDVRRLETPHARAFAVFAERIVRFGGSLGSLVSRVAVVHQGGLGGAVVEGFTKVVGTPFPVAFFVDPVEALASLGAADAARLSAELNELHARATGTSPLVRDLRAILEASLTAGQGGSTTRNPSKAMPEVARALGLSPRMLQRRLAAEGTSFQAVAWEVKLEAAKTLLAETDETVEAIAYRLGSASTHHFAMHFRESTGETPARWRAGARRSTGSAP